MTADTKTILRRSALLSNLTDEDLDSLLALANERTFEAGAPLVQAGSTDSLGMWVIIEGSVDVSRNGQHLATLGPGEHVGEMALVTDIRRSADVTATTPLRTLQLTRWDLRGLVADHPDIALAIMDAMAARLAEQNALR
ncbi:MAG: cyclic nucleotide-binding domain-containing protein [Acidimicrobiia bacterium]|nr:cyclic nucleotide-binding domain-containing protein [Acidimicrobiia bacterium]